MFPDFQFQYLLSISSRAGAVGDLVLRYPHLSSVQSESSHPGGTSPPNDGSGGGVVVSIPDYLISSCNTGVTV